MSSDPWIIVLAFLTALIAGAINSVAGGGTLLTFPILLWMGLDAKTANATSTVGLWAGSLGGSLGYRLHLKSSGILFWPFFLASFAGGAVGSLVFLCTQSQHFRQLVPWLIITATLLFALQSLLKRSTQQPAHSHLHKSRWPLVALIQFLVGIYGGYFGAGMGILMLAILGVLGLSHIHLMNGVKNIAATVINGVTIIIFVIASFVTPEQVTIDWPIALAMTGGSCLGGYGCSGLASKVKQEYVRWVVISIGLAGAIGTAYKIWFAA